MLAALCAAAGCASQSPSVGTTGAANTLAASAVTATTTPPTSTTVSPTTVPPTTVPPTTVPPTTVPPTTVSPTTVPVATAAVVSTYVFPFVGRNVSYGTTHHDYPAIDVFGCRAGVVAPTSGTVTEIRTVDLWEPKVNDPATRGGKYVTMIGGDGVRYYFAHLASVSTTVGANVAPGDALGVMGQTGDARLSACHTHVGISWPCPTKEWQVRRGEVWPPKYLDAWRRGEQLSPVDEVQAVEASHSSACLDAAAARSAAAA
ncbi:MAG: peptidoglycan DD-metalloendopeptidase family protein [Actinobacteria bacterium]|nr:peptidoglycan DD-metalloendopeptidase family protein [Actinomycetota bacterium]